MSFKLNIKDGMTPDLLAKLDELKNSRAVMAAVGKALEVELRSVYLERNAQPNKQGWPKRNFWRRQVANKVALSRVEPGSATVSIASPELIHKINGGTITPKRSKTLAIPANGKAYRMGGPRASGKDFQFIPLNQGNLVGALLTPETYSVGKTKGKGDGKMRGGEVMYWLVRKVTHAPDPSADPYSPAIRNRLYAACLDAAWSAVNRIMSRR